jgi:arylsulfatase A-like enzyme
MPAFTRTVLLFAGGLLAGIMVLPRCGVAGAPDPPLPNVILCMTDDQGWGDTGYNGHPVLRTPHLDQMAGEGIRFERFYAGAPVCSPTRGSCLTGRHPHRYGVVHANVGHMKREEITLAEALKTRGYMTGHFGKWHLGTLTTKMADANRGRPGDTKDYSPPWENGFDECFSTESKVPTCWKEGDYERYGTRYWTGPDNMVPAAEVAGDDSKLIMDHALPFIRRASERKTPFLAVIWFHAPHLPVVSAPPYTDGYSKHVDYYGCMTAMDEQVGRLRAGLLELGLAENTMLWFCSDNGPEGNGAAPGRATGLRGRKRSLYEGGVRVPGLVVWPGMINKSRTVTMPCSTSDYFPTVLDAVGGWPPPAGTRPYDGISLLPLLKGDMRERPQPIAFEFQDQVSLVGNQYKIYSRDGGKTYELYDLIADPAEKVDISAQHPQVVRNMGAVLEAWRASCRNSREGLDY